MSENSSGYDDSSGSKFSMGSTSALFLFLLIGIFIPFPFLLCQPQYQGTVDMGLVLLMYNLGLFLGLPLLAAIAFTGAAAIIKNNGRAKGIITISIIAIVFLWAIIQSGLNH